MKVEGHGGHYYIDPTISDVDKVIEKAKDAAMHTGHTQLIHPHEKPQRCGVRADHIIIYPTGLVETIRVTEPKGASKPTTTT